ncbi:IPT/TIG domain-containing protein [Prosthecomicrobium pneumaticum]|uniref:Autotransporter domain-containing protein n=1 Tax=Prosthecomicrobium pneumaticum TaxID=81895 RepID=A0A7W9L1N3_9HYPH|nr:hypothetical protein [Prosthecomicrobium pneumaticum]
MRQRAARLGAGLFLLLVLVGLSSPAAALSDACVAVNADWGAGVTSPQGASPNNKVEKEYASFAAGEVIDYQASTSNSSNAELNAEPESSDWNGSAVFTIFKNDYNDYAVPDARPGNGSEVSLTGTLILDPDEDYAVGVYSSTASSGTATATLTCRLASAGGPELTSLSPDFGVTTGGDSVTLTGTGFTGATGVTFGGTAATDLSVTNDTTLTVKTPAHAEGAVDVVVTTPGGSDTLASGFTYYPPVTLSPESGALDGGTVGVPYSVFIDKSGGGAAPYTISLAAGALPAGIELDPDWGGLVGTPTEAGTATFTIRYTDGLGLFGSAEYTITIVAAASGPELASLSPTTGPTTGGTSVTLTGTGFTGATEVTFGGTAATDLSVTNDTTLTVKTPAHAAGAVDVVVTTGDGSDTLASGFTYQAVTLSLSPAAGALPGGTVGTGYSVSVTASDGTSPYSYAVTSGALPGGVNLNASTGALSGTPTAEESASFTITATDNVGNTGAAAYTIAIAAAASGPELTSLSPTTGPTTGGTSVTLTGTGFTGATGVTFGGTAGTDLSVTNDTTLTVKTPAHVAGAVDVVVTTGDGSDTLDDGFTYQAVTLSLSPAAGALPGGTAATDYSVSVTASDGASPYSYAVTSGALPGGVNLNASTGALSGTPTTEESASFTITATDSLGNTGSAAYTIAIAAEASGPELASLSPTTGPTTGGTSVTLTGTGFTGATGVTFGGTAATDLSVTNDTTLTVKTPAHVAGAVDVVVTTGDGSDTLASGFTYQAVTLSLSPAAGALPGGTVGTGYSVSVTASDGTSPYSYAVTSGALPAGVELALDAGGLYGALSGTPTTEETASFTITATDNVGNTGSAAYTIAIAADPPARPDPSLDVEVIGLVNAQADATRRVARIQLQNFEGRLERLHDDDERWASSMEVRIGVLQDRSARPEDSFFERATTAVGDAGPQGLLAFDEAADPQASPADAAIARPAADRGPLAVWSGGFIDFSRRDGGIDLDSTAVGVSGGVDYRFSPALVAGFGFGYGRDRSDVGDNGTETLVDAYSGALYGSYKPIDGLFLDGLLGGSWIDLDSSRYVTVDGSTADGSRSGTQLFGSLTAAYEFRDDAWLISPYARAGFSRAWLDGFSETGGGVYGLTYGDQTVDSLSGALGARLRYVFDTEWGSIAPEVRAEYSHDFADGSRVGLGYSDLGGLPYAVETEADARDIATVGLALGIRFDPGWLLDLDYRTRLDGDGVAGGTGSARLGTRF